MPYLHASIMVNNVSPRVLASYENVYEYINPDSDRTICSVDGNVISLDISHWCSELHDVKFHTLSHDYLASVTHCINTLIRNNCNVFITVAALPITGEETFSVSVLTGQHLLRCKDRVAQFDAYISEMTRRINNELRLE